ncbi:cytochrome P450 [Dactylosporangium sp. NPDC000555]|uniref:cytochrome P450 n=1 Tax=Dactylosporangium sp. NPDC000555 TaxID=3154260 RepID=UPI003323EAD6
MSVALRPAETGMSWRTFTRAYNADRLGFLNALPAIGPVVRMGANLVFVSDPALIEAVFRGTNTDFQMTLNRRLEAVAAGRGDAALEAWMSARRRATSAVHRTATDGDATGQVELSHQIDAWTAAAAPVSVVEDLTRLNLRASVRLVAGGPDPGLETGTLALLPRLIAVVDDGTRLPGPFAMLVRRHRHARRDDQALRDHVLALADSAPGSGGIVGELAGTEVDRATIANLAVAMLLAGTLVPAAAGAWILALLAANPTWQDRSRADPEARTSVINEALRLYPPTWLISRTVAADGVYAGWSLRAGDEVVISPYVSQRDPVVFPEPERFAPERWAGLRPGIAQYFPFGAGARRCVAAELSLRRLDELVQQVLRRATRLSGGFPRSMSTTSTLFPADLRVRFAD